MGCRIGMATDVADRVQKLKDDKKVPSYATYVVLKIGMTYEDANAFEQEERKECGAHCEGSAGGKYKAGKVWSVYQINW